MGQGPDRGVRATVGHLLHLTAPPPHRQLLLLFNALSFLLALSLLFKVGAAAGGVGDAAVVLQVHFGEDRVFRRAGPRPLPPKASWPQSGLGGRGGLCALLSVQTTQQSYVWLIAHSSEVLNSSIVCYILCKHTHTRDSIYLYMAHSHCNNLEGLCRPAFNNGNKTPLVFQPGEEKSTKKS